MDLFLYGILSLLLGGTLALLLPDNWKVRTLALFSLVGLVLILVPSFIVLFSNRPMTMGSGFLSLRADASAAFFQMMFSSLFFFTVVYTAGFLKRVKSPAEISFSLFFLDLAVVCLLMLTVASNAVAFLLIWQMLILSVFFALVSGRARDGYRKALRYLVLLETGFVFILVALISLSVRSGSLEMAAYGNVLGDVFFSDIMLALLFVGFGFSAGWMVKAWSGTFLPLEAVLATLFSAAGIFGFIRMLALVPSYGVTLVVIVVVLSAAAALWGAVRSASQVELYSFLANSAVLYYGMAGLGMGVGLAGIYFRNDMMALLGFASALFQTVNHAISKLLAYFSAGSAFSGMYAVSLTRPFGPIRSDHAASIYFIIALMSLLGLPVLNGFINFFMVSSGIISVAEHGLFQSILLPVMLAAIVLPLTLMIPAYSRLIGNVGQGVSGRTRPKKQRGWLSSGFTFLSLAILVFTTGLFPQYIAIFAVNPASDLARVSPAISDHNIMAVFSAVFNSLNMVTKTLLIFLGLALLLYLVRLFFLTKKEIDGTALSGKRKKA